MKTVNFFEVPSGMIFIYEGIEYVKTDKLARNAFRLEDGVPKYFYTYTKVEVKDND